MLSDAYFELFSCKITFSHFLLHFSHFRRPNKILFGYSQERTRQKIAKNLQKIANLNSNFASLKPRRCEVVSKAGLQEALADLAAIVNRCCADLAAAGAELAPRTGTVAGYVGSKSELDRIRT